VDSLNDGFGIIDNEGKISYANKKWGTLLEYSPDEMVGRPITEFLDEHNRAVLEENIRKRKSGEPSQYEIEWTTKSGHRVCTIVSGAPIIDDDDQYSGSFAVITDITSRKQIEEDLRESEERYRQLLETSPDAVTLTDLEGNIILANNQAARMHGAESTDELHSLSVLDLIVPEEHTRALDNLKRTLEHGAVRNIEYTMKKRDGSTFSAELSASLLRNADGEPMGFIGVVRDITDRKDATKKQRESEELLSRAQRMASLGYWDWNVVEDRVAWSDEVYQIWGLKPDGSEITNERFLNTLHPDDRDRVENRIEDAFTGKKPYDFDFRIIRPDGSVRIVHSIAEVTYESSKKPVRLFGTVMDVTDQKAAEDALQKSGQLLQSIYDAIPDVIISTDADMIITSCNKAALHVLGYTPEELVGKHYEYIIGEEMINHPDQKNRERMLNEKGILAQDGYIFRKKNGDTFPASFVVAMIRDDYGSHKGMVGTIRDITERLKSEDALRDSEKQIRAERDRVMLYLDVLGHDIRNQLQVILGGVQTVEETVTLPAATRILRLVVEASQRCDDIIRKSKAMEGLTSVPLVQTILDDVLGQCIKELFEGRDDVIVKERIPGIKAAILADEYLRNLLQTLLENAVIHNKREVKRVWVSLKETDGGYEVAVGDDGEGVSPPQREWLFDTARRYGGVSLHQAKQVVDKYGGRIGAFDRVPGSPGQGAEFRIWFPKFV
jgi:PAS domain S-box-containing protein